MEIRLDWHDPFELRSRRRDRLTYAVDELEHVPDECGIYIFGRRHSLRLSPVYIGKAANLRRRVIQQLNNNRLMNALLDAPSGQRELVIGELHLRQGQQMSRVLKLVERGLIKLALAQGHSLVNVQGTRIRSHSVSMAGNRHAREWLPGRTVQFEGGA